MGVKQPWVSQIRNTRNSAEQISVLKALKNEVVGHPLRKEAVVTQGVLDPVVRLVFNKSGSIQNGKAHDHSFAARALSEEEIVRLQGLQIIASIALGGPSFLAPLQTASVLPSLLSNICPSSNPAQLVLAALRALSNLADSSALATSLRALSIPTIADALFSRQNLNSLSQILSQSSPSTSVQTQISIAASLISKLCREERHQQGIANSGVLDALATSLASFIVAEGLVIPRAEILAQKDGLQEYFPQPAPNNANFSVILEAISVIIAESKLRASQLLYSPSILATLPMGNHVDPIGTPSARSAWNSFNSSGGNTRLNQLNAVDYLLPMVPPNERSSNSQPSAFPPLGSNGSKENLAAFARNYVSKHNVAPLPSWGDSPSLESALIAQDLPASDEEPESPLVAYLILCARACSAMERLMAAAVLTVLYRAGLTHKTRETGIGLLVVPLLVYMMDESITPKQESDNYAYEEAEKLEWAIQEKAPAILAMLVTDNEFLQKASYDAGVLPKLSKLLKVSYDPVPDSDSPQPWAPHIDEEAEGIEVQLPRLGHGGQPPALAHKVKVRESTLKAIAAVVTFKDEYRKAVVEQGMMPYIVESMSAHPGKPTPKSTERADKSTNGSSSDETAAQGYGVHPISVLIAACGTVRALSRSVSVLRTTLIDNGVAEPVFRLLRHPDIEVQIAAAAAVCNLCLDVSPMRETIAEMGVVKILCEHARSMNAKLRLNAVWGLKHFVQNVSSDTKRHCLEELGQGWLVQLICDDTEDEALHLHRKAERRSGSPEGMDEDTEMDQFEEQIDSAFGTSYSRSSISRPSSGSKSKSVQQAELRLAALREAELNPTRKARKDDIAVQEQGLDFIRNLIGGNAGNTTETADMIDFLFSTLGQDRVFEILTSKLRPKPLNTYHRRLSSTGENKIIPPQAEIISAVGYILVHMAASVPRHRQIVISQTELLKLLIPQFNHPNIEVRLSLCSLVTNLTWMDDQNDGLARAARANELRKLGFFEKLEMLESDPELNVRERAKSAIWQMRAGYS